MSKQPNDWQDVHDWQDVPAPTDSRTFKPGGGDFRDPKQDQSTLEMAKGTARDTYNKTEQGARRLVRGGVDFLGQLDEAPIPTLYDTAKGIIGAIPSALQTFHSGRTSQNPNDASRLMSSGTADFITQGIPAAMGAEDLLGKAKGALDYHKSIAPTRVTRDTINNFSTVIKGRGMAASGTAPQGSAITVHPLWQQAVHELGFSPEDVAVDERAPQSDLHGDLYRGTTRPKHIQLSGASPDLMSADGHPTPLPIATADKMVDIADRPIRSTIDHYRSVLAPQAQASIAASLDMHAANASTVGDAALAGAYKNLAEKVRQSDGTVGSLDDFKVQANKETNRLFKLNPSGMSAASATPVFAWRTLGDEVRGHLYPFIESQGGPSLTRYGQIEAQAIHARDGIYNNWAQSAGGQASDALVTYLDHVLGKSPAQTVVNPGSKAGMASRALGGPPSALSDFNTRFKSSIGDMRGYQPPSPVALPQMPPPPAADPMQRLAQTRGQSVRTGSGTPPASAAPYTSADPNLLSALQKYMNTNGPASGKSAAGGGGAPPASAIHSGLLTPEELSAIQQYLYGGGGK